LDGVKGNQGNGFLKGRCEVIRLDVRRLGAQPTKTDDSKPIHTSEFQSSSGCPSVNQKDNDIIRHLASYGNSMYIAYTAKESEKKHLEAPFKDDYCKKDPDIPFGIATAEEGIR
jgi:hypothetical protein